MGTITFATLWGNTMAAMTAVAEGAQASLTSFMHNATTYVGEIIGTHASQISGQELYAGVNVAQLNTFERLWMSYYQSFDNPVVATGIMSFLIHELVYFGRSLPWMAIDAMPYFNKWKLQETKVPTWEQQWACTKYVLATHFTVELPQIYLFHPMATYFGMETWQVPFPSPVQVRAQDPPRVLGAIRSCSRVRAPYRGPRARHRNSRLALALLCPQRRWHAHHHHVHLDRPPPLPGHRCALRLPVPLVSQRLLPALGRRGPPRLPPSGFHKLLLDLVPPLGLDAGHRHVVPLVPRQAARREGRQAGARRHGSA